MLGFGAIAVAYGCTTVCRGVAGRIVDVTLQGCEAIAHKVKEGTAARWQGLDVMQQVKTGAATVAGTVAEGYRRVARWQGLDVMQQVKTGATTVVRGSWRVARGVAPEMASGVASAVLGLATLGLVTDQFCNPLFISFGKGCEEINVELLMRVMTHVQLAGVGYDLLRTAWKVAQGRWAASLKAGCQAAMAMTGRVCVLAGGWFCPGFLSYAGQVSTIALTSLALVSLGIKDLRARQRGSGLGKIALGTFGLATLGYSLRQYVLHELEPNIGEEDRALPRDTVTFLKRHDAEIQEMHRKYHRSMGDRYLPPRPWQYVGNGKFKVAFTHPGLPGHLLKLPQEGCGDFLRRHYLGFQKGKEVLDLHPELDRIALPEIWSGNTSNGAPYVVETMFKWFNFTRDPFPLDDCSVLSKQLETFQALVGLCDVKLICGVQPLELHNIGITFGRQGFQAVPYDLDCLKH